MSKNKEQKELLEDIENDDISSKKDKKTSNQKDIKHNETINNKIKQVAKNRRNLIVCDILMLICCVTAIVSLFYTQFLVCIIALVLLVSFTFTEKTRKSFKNLPEASVILLSVLAVPVVVVIDIVKIKKFDKEIRSLQEQMIR